MEANNKTLGNAGEDLAEVILRRRGYDIADRNYTCKFGELDIVATKGSLLAFVEVKTRSSQSFGLGREAVNREKRRHIRNCAKCYLAEKRPSYDAIDFQVIEISAEHIENLRF